MKIIHMITSSILGGAQSVLVEIVNTLIEEHEVYVIAGGEGQMWDLLDPRVNKIKMHHLKREISPINDFKTLLQLKKIYRQIHPDIIHLHSSKAGVLGRLAFPSSKIVYTVHGFDTIRLANRKFMPLEKILAPFTARIVTVSEFDKINMQAERFKGNILTILNGIKTDKRDVPTRPWQDSSRKKVLAIARLEPPKDHHLFIHIAEAMPSIDFYWIGNNRPVDDIPVPENVHFLGEFPQAGDLFQFVDIALLTSNYEGLPMSIIEAMKYGKPVVSSNVGGISEIVRNDINGYTCSNDAASFTDALNKVIDDLKQGNQMGLQSQKIFETELTSDIMVGHYKKLYEELLMGV